MATYYNNFFEIKTLVEDIMKKARIIITFNVEFK